MPSNDLAQVTAMNTALFQLGKSPIADLSQASLGTSAAAQKLYPQMAQARQTVLKRHGWLCALTYWSIPAPSVIAGDVNWKYAAAYKLPANYLRMWEMWTPDPIGIPWLGEINWPSLGLAGPPSSPLCEAWEVNSIDTDQGAVDVLRSNLAAGVWFSYVRDATWGALDPHVLDAVGFELAARGALNVTGDAQIASKLEGRAEGKVQMAISTDAAEQGGQASVAPSIPMLLREISR